MAASVGGDNRGIFSSGDGATNVQITLATLRSVTEVEPVAGPVGVPAVGLFVGRDDELSHLDEALTTGDVVVQAVHGLGGIGKTSLAARYAQEHRDRFSQVVWITADTPSNVDACLVNFATALEPELAGSLPSEALRERAVTWLCAHQDWLVVLDNVTDPADVRPLIARATSGRYILTTRRSTGWHGLARLLPLDVLTPDAARELVAKTLGPDLAHLLDGVDDLCEELGHLPLALDQAAAYMVQTRVTATDYLRLLREHPTTMLAEASEGTDATRTIARIWTLTLGRLSDDPLCEAILRILAWFAPDDIPRYLLADIAPEPVLLRALGRLAAHSMITLDAGTISVHRLVQTAARTPGSADDATLIDQARDDAINLLRKALPDDPYEPATWPTWRELISHVEAYAERATPADDDSNTAYVLGRAATFLEDQGSLAGVVAYFQRVLDQAERAGGSAHPDALIARHNLAHAYNSAGDPTRAIALYEATAAEWDHLLGPEHVNTLMTQNNLAAIYTSVGDSPRAITLFERILAVRTRVQGPRHPETLMSRNSLASAYDIAGDAPRAIPMLEQIIADCEDVFGPDHPNTIVSRNNLASARFRAGDPKRAIPVYERVLADRERVLGPNHPDTLMARNNLASAYDTAGDTSRAIPMLEQTVADYTRMLGSAHPSTLMTRNNLASAYENRGDLGRAVALYEQTVAGCELTLGSEHALTLTACCNLAYTYARTGDTTRAIVLYEQALAGCERVFGPDDARARLVRDNLDIVRRPPPAT